MTDFKETVLNAVKAKSDLTLRQIAVLIVCNDIPEAIDRQIKAISATLALAPPVITRCADRLQTEGLLTRGKIPMDKRSCVLDITKKGRAALAKLIDGPPAKKASAKTMKKAA